MSKPAPRVIVRKAGKSMPKATPPNDNDADDKATGRDAIIARLQERSKK